VDRRTQMGRGFPGRRQFCQKTTKNHHRTQKGSKRQRNERVGHGIATAKGGGGTRKIRHGWASAGPRACFERGARKRGLRAFRCKDKGPGTSACSRDSTGESPCTLGDARQSHCREGVKTITVGLPWPEHTSRRSGPSGREKGTASPFFVVGRTQTRNQTHT